jgi:hypothetical protein
MRNGEKQRAGTDEAGKRFPGGGWIGFHYRNGCSSDINF